MTTDTTKITQAANDLSSGLAKGGTAAKTLGTEIANAIAALDTAVAALDTRIDVLESAEPPPVDPPPTGDTSGLITNFNPACSAEFQIGGEAVANDNANKTWSITQRDDYTLRFEVRQGDTYSSSGFTDSGANRSECSVRRRFQAGRELELLHTTTVLPGPISTASWLDLCQLHAGTDNPSTPFSIQLQENTDTLQVVICSPVNSWERLYLASSPIRRGTAIKFRSKVIMSPGNNNGYVGVWLDDVQLVDWHGRVGADNSDYFWKFGAYRGDVAEVFQVDFSHVTVKG